MIRINKSFVGIALGVAYGILPFFVLAADTGNQPRYYKGKTPVDFVFCGETYAFDIANYSGKIVWLEQDFKKDGDFNDTRIFSGPFSLPMLPYKATCNKDEGSYIANVYTLAKNGTKDQFIGNAFFSIEPNSVGATDAEFKMLDLGIFSLKLGSDHPAIRNKIYFNPDGALVELLRRYQDDMDVIAVISTQSLVNFVKDPICYGCAYSTRALADGIGVFSQELNPKYIQLHRYLTSGGRFNHVAIISVNDHVGSNASDYAQYTYVLLHEIGHKWSTFIGKSGGYGTNPLSILEEQQFAHWGYVSDNHDSLMAYGPARLIENTDRTFSPLWKNSSSLVFNDFDLYLMGVLPSEQVTPMFSVSSPILGPEARQGNISGRLRGIKRNITINDIIHLDGTRTPAFGMSKNNLTNSMRISFLIVQGPSGTSKELNNTKDFISTLSRQLPSEWNRATKSLATISTFMPQEKKPLEGFAVGVSDEFTDGEIKKIAEDLLHTVHDDTTEFSKTTREKQKDFENSIGTGSSLVELEQQLVTLLRRLQDLTGEILCQVPSTTLARHDENSEVTKLQRFLSQFTHLYPEQSVIGYFGPATERAVTRFQDTFGIPKENGVVGDATRQKMRFLCGVL